ncbi:MAG: polyhydroxyalkanoate depolymerase [Sphingomonadaceae bacterium]
MIYLAYEALRRSTRPWAWMAEKGHKITRSEANPLRNTLAMRMMATSFELQDRALKDYGKPAYQIWENYEDHDVVVDQHVVSSLPFGDLLRFNLETGTERPKVMIAAALSGHYGTLLQGTVRTFVQDFDTHITDWRNCREVPPEAGDFGFDGYVTHLIKFLEDMGPGTHVVATCQAAPPAMVATAVIAKEKPQLMPASLTLMGGPVDTRIAPSQMSELAGKLPMGWFENVNIQTIPSGFTGSGREVYPGFTQLAGFIALNPKPHLKQYMSFIKNSLKGDDEALEKFRNFYDEYFAVLDMDKKFYLDTLEKVFFDHHIATGQMEYEGELVDFESVTGLPLLTVEGQNDHLCPPGQTVAAHDVFSGIDKELHQNHLQPGVGHYGVFSGSKFQSEIYPVIRDFIWNAIDGKVHAKSKVTESKRKAKKVPDAVLSEDIPV